MNLTKDSACATHFEFRLYLWMESELKLKLGEEYAQNVFF